MTDIPLLMQNNSCIFIQLNQGLQNELLKTFCFQKWDFKTFLLFVLLHRLTIKKCELGLTSREKHNLTDFCEEIVSGQNKMFP